MRVGPVSGGCELSATELEKRGADITLDQFHLIEMKNQVILTDKRLSEGRAISGRMAGRRLPRSRLVAGYRAASRAALAHCACAAPPKP